MIEILYRGKNSKKEWEYGVPLICVTSQTAYMAQLFSYNIRVDIESIGKYIGLEDRKSRKIFTGDILKDEYGELFLVVEEKTRVVLKRQNRRVTTWQYTHKKEIVGNIHDNPNLWRWTNGK